MNSANGFILLSGDQEWKYSVICNWLELLGDWPQPFFVLRLNLCSKEIFPVSVLLLFTMERIILT